MTGPTVVVGSMKTQGLLWSRVTLQDVGGVEKGLRKGPCKGKELESTREVWNEFCRSNLTFLLSEQKLLRVYSTVDQK